MTETKNCISRVLRVGILVISDTRTLTNDTSGDILVSRVQAARHQVIHRDIVPDDEIEIRRKLEQWIKVGEVEVIISSGGTGFKSRDVTPEAVRGLQHQEIEGFGELFRSNSYNKIGTSTILSRALGVISGGVLIFALPGSPSACGEAWDDILKEQLDSCHKPCNLTEILSSPRDS